MIAVRVLGCAMALGAGIGIAAGTDLGTTWTSKARPADHEPLVAPPSQPLSLEEQAEPFVPEAPAPDEGEPHAPAVLLTSVVPFEGEEPETDVVGRRYRDGLVITGAANHRVLLFTFDDGPDRRTTPHLLDVLDREHVKAIFFLTASRIRGETMREREQAEIAREIVRRGHIVGNHTMDHLQLALLDNEHALEQIDGASDVIARVIGQRPFLLRPPGGARSARVDGLISSRHYTSVLWNLGSGDFQVRTPEEVRDTWLRVLHIRERDFGERGGIVLLHDTYEWSVAAVPLILDEIRRRNCRLLARGEELYDVVDDLSMFFVPRADAPPSSEAPRVVLSENLLAQRQARLRDETTERCEQMVASR